MAKRTTPTPLMVTSSGTKYLPQDINASLGKLPPSAVELEEVVLGAIMIESTSLAQVSTLLSPDHFYIEAHRHIFEAILDLKAASEPIDFRSVIQKLKKTGKLEPVGGHLYIVDLTNKVSNSAGIEHAAKIIVEMAVKRELIHIASKIHHDAYEDTADAWDLLEKTVNNLTFFQKNATPETSETKIKVLWEKTLINTEPPEDITLVDIKGTPIVVVQNHTLIVGKKKSRKTLFIAFLISKFLKNNPNSANKVLLFDTEQGRSHVWRLRKKIHQLSGLWVPIFYMRGMAPAERRDFITGTCQYWSSSPAICVIDGIRDCMTNINDPVETTEVLVWLEKILLQHDMGIIEVLHLNKTDNNARGHIGTELLNKAVCTIEMELDDKNGCTVVKCESSRDKPFDTFAFSHDKDGLPEEIGVPIAGNVIPVDEKRSRLEIIFSDGPLAYKELVEGLRDHFSVGINKAQRLVAEFVRDGWLIKSGKPRDPETVYKLLVQTNGISNGHHPAEPIVTQLSIVEENLQIPDDLPF